MREHPLQAKQIIRDQIVSGDIKNIQQLERLTHEILHEIRGSLVEPSIDYEDGWCEVVNLKDKRVSKKPGQFFDDLTLRGVTINSEKEIDDGWVDVIPDTTEEMHLKLLNQQIPDIYKEYLNELRTITLAQQMYSCVRSLTVTSEADIEAICNQLQTLCTCGSVINTDLNLPMLDFEVKKDALADIQRYGNSERAKAAIHEVAIMLHKQADTDLLPYLEDPESARALMLDEIVTGKITNPEQISILQKRISQAFSGQQELISKYNAVFDNLRWALQIVGKRAEGLTHQLTMNELRLIKLSQSMYACVRTSKATTEANIEAICSQLKTVCASNSSVSEAYFNRHLSMLDFEGKEEKLADIISHGNSELAKAAIGEVTTMLYNQADTDLMPYLEGPESARAILLDEIITGKFTTPEQILALHERVYHALDEEEELTSRYDFVFDSLYWTMQLMNKRTDGFANRLTINKAIFDLYQKCGLEEHAAPVDVEFSPDINRLKFDLHDEDIETLKRLNRSGLTLRAIGDGCSLNLITDS